jgi:predicted O-methyltransferase YrrM
MTNKSIQMDDRLYEYLLANSLREPELWRRLREETAKLPMAMMQIAPEQGQFMHLLARLIGAKRCLEVGTFTGYSALAVASALPPDGLLICCDISAEWTAIAQRYWAEAGLADRIALHLRPALQTLDELLAQGQAESFDFAFIDADKTNYGNYYERCLKLIRPGGLIVVDNTLWSGAVADPAVQDEDTQAIRTLNAALHRDPRIDLSLIPVADGLALVMKKYN